MYMIVCGPGLTFALFVDSLYPSHKTTGLAQSIRSYVAVFGISSQDVSMEGKTAKVAMVAY